MARPWFKRAWTRVVPEAAERSTYVLFSSLALLLLFWQWRPLGGVVWSVESQAGRVGVYGLYFFGWLLLLASTFMIDHFDLFGLRQVWRHLLGRPYVQTEFRTPGLYRHVRHPIYLSWLCIFWAAPRDDGGPPCLRAGDDRLHLRRDSVRGEGFDSLPRRRLPRLPRARADDLPLRMGKAERRKEEYEYLKS
jgi:protein-S-isoprenylcysteine O-methyltransferase Ste14